MIERRPVDQVADVADHDAASNAIETLTERQQWITYFALYNRGLRVERAPHEIARLAPRKEA